MTKVQFRKYMSKYLPERMMWTGIHPIYNDTKVRDTHRYYWASKMAKDFIIMSGKEEFTYQDIDSYFVDRVILNYLNQLVVEAINRFEQLMIKEAGIKEVWFDEHLSHHERIVPFLRKAKRIAKFIDLDNIYYQFADIIERNSTEIFRENLGDITDFREGADYHVPILDHRTNNFTVDYFRTNPEEPFIIFEEKFDNTTERLDRRVRRSPLSQDMGIHDVKLQYQFEQRDINNTYIMRGFHIIVRDYEGNVINDEYGMKSPLKDGRKTDGKVMWYRPHDTMDPKYKLGEEIKKRYVMKRPKRFKIEHFDDKRAKYFQRIKKSIFLPRCLRDLQTTYIYMKHDWVRCPHTDHGRVADDFFDRLGIQRNKDYVFEFMGVW